jgi:uncharacterized protein YecT (DUF1311 family)
MAIGKLMPLGPFWRYCLISYALLLATSAAAQSPDPAPWKARFDACIASADRAIELEGCKALASRFCMEELPDGQTTFGMAGCNAMETALWDDLLNADWPAHKAWAEAADAEERKYFGDQYSTRLGSLIAAQRAWIAFRDAECALEYAVWGSGSMRHILGTACVADMTADRVISLRSLREEM